jgi:hypothetical protein
MVDVVVMENIAVMVDIVVVVDICVMVDIVVFKNTVPKYCNYYQTNDFTTF